jgi:hypothetical protein
MTSRIATSFILRGAPRWTDDRLAPTWLAACRWGYHAAMDLRGRVRPGKSVSTLGLVVAVVLVLIGLTVVTPAMGAIGLLWTIVALAIALFHAYNLLAPGGVSVVDVDLERGSSELPNPSDFDRRLHDLEALRSDGLISQEEYERKRTEILADRW